MQITKPINKIVFFFSYHDYIKHKISLYYTPKLKKIKKNQTFLPYYHPKQNEIKPAPLSGVKRILSVKQFALKIFIQLILTVILFITLSMAKRCWTNYRSEWQTKNSLNTTFYQVLISTKLIVFFHHQLNFYSL